MESFFPWLKTERIGRKVYRRRAAARGRRVRLHREIPQHNPQALDNGYLSQVEFERKVGLA